MRGNNDGFMLNFLVVLILLNAVFLVVAQTGGAGFVVGCSVTYHCHLILLLSIEKPQLNRTIRVTLILPRRRCMVSRMFSTDCTRFDWLSRVSLAGDSSPTDSTPMMPSTSVLISSTTTGTAPRSSSLKRGRLSPGATAGIVVATVIPFILAVGIYLLYLLKRQRRPPRHGPVDLTVEPDPIGSPVCTSSRHSLMQGTATNVFPVPQTKNLSSQLHSSPTQRPTSWGMVSPHGVSAQSLPQSTAWVQHPSIPT